MWILFMMSSTFVGAILGLVFAVPRARAEYAAQATERFTANSNLEQISDWLTKILVGAGLVELKDAPQLLSSMGEYLGRGLQVPNPGAFAASAVIYGVGVGFGAAYLWTRLRLRLLLESSEKHAVEIGRTEELTRQLAAATKDPTTKEPTEIVRRVAHSAIRTTMAADPRQLRPILWVDDLPGNNVQLVGAFSSLRISVDLALTTAQGMEFASKRTYGLIISDLGRRENGVDDPMAGLHLVQELRKADITTPIIIFATRRALALQDELMEAGASLVTNRPSEVFDFAIAHVATYLRE